MGRFVQSVLGLTPAADAENPDTAVFFDLPDGSRFGVADEREPGGGTSRSIGFLVADLDQATAELRSAGVAVDDPVSTGRQRYAHFTAPDGALYELVENIDPDDRSDV